MHVFPGSGGIPYTSSISSNPLAVQQASAVTRAAFEAAKAEIPGRRNVRSALRMLNLQVLASSLQDALSRKPRSALAAWYPPIAGRMGTAASPSSSPQAAAAAAAGTAAGVPSSSVLGSARGGAAAEAGAASSFKLHRNVFTVLASIVRNEGSGALMRGLLPRMIVNGPASAATFILYEQVLKLSQKDNSGGGGVGSGREDGSSVVMARG